MTNGFEQTKTLIRGNYTKIHSKNKCPVCGGVGTELIKFDELEDQELKREILEKFGSDYKMQEFGIPCRACNGGYVQRMESAKKLSNIPSSYYESKMDNFDRTLYKDSNGKIIDISREMKIVVSFIEDYERWEKDKESAGYGLYIHSSMRGSGKTFLASCICNELIARHPMNTKFVSAADLLNISRHSDGSGNYETDPLSLLRNCRLLVIDDIGVKVNGVDWMNDVLFQIIDSRYQNKLITIYTSNKQIEELELDDRIVDRIYSKSIVIHLPEYSARSRESYEHQKKIMKKYGVA